MISGTPADDGGPGWVRRDALEDPTYWWEHTRIEAPNLVSRLGVLDVDGDDDADLVLLRGCPGSSLHDVPPYGDGSPSPIVVYRVDEMLETYVSDASLLEPDDLQLVATAADPVSGDFTGDGREDLLVTTAGIDNFFGNGVYGGDISRLLVQQPSGGLVDESSTRMPLVRSNAERVVAGDVDDDGDLDLHIERFGGDGPSSYLTYPPPGDGPCQGIHLNDNGVFIPDFTAMPPSSYQAEPPTRQLFFDVDADGDLDLLSSVLSGYRTPWMTFWENDGAGQFTKGAHGWLPRKPRAGWHFRPKFLPADLDLDGTDELFGGMEAASLELPERSNFERTPADEGGRLGLFRRSAPSGPFIDASDEIDYPAFIPAYLQAADLNQDGRSDLVMDSPFRPMEIFFATESGGLERIGRLFPHTGSVARGRAALGDRLLHV